ncbi:hypothetical protein, partial [Bacteroides uniformis]|uniref:hypothetical protein n=1 Tax=Bacteroides uniformis TaxID=820 RepID=UPI001E44CA05
DDLYLNPSFHLHKILDSVRNPEAHSRIILNNAEKTRATVFCQEVIKRCQLHRDELGELE